MKNVSYGPAPGSYTVNGLIATNDYTVRFHKSGSGVFITNTYVDILDNYELQDFVVPATIPAPTLTSVTPDSAPAGNAAITITLTGTNFINGSQVQWNGTPLTTSHISPIQLNATVPAILIASAGIANVTVFNPAPGGGTSGSVTFNIRNPQPSITSLSPSTLPAGSPAFDLTVFGTGFSAHLSCPMGRPGYTDSLCEWYRAGSVDQPGRCVKSRGEDGHSSQSRSRWRHVRWPDFHNRPSNNTGTGSGCCSEAGWRWRRVQDRLRPTGQVSRGS